MATTGDFFMAPDKESIMKGPACVPRSVLLSGPLAEYGPGFAGELRRLGFTPLSREKQLRLLAHLSRWMEARGLRVGQLTGGRVDEFLAERRATRAELHSRRATRTLLRFLSGLGVLPVEEPASPTTTDLVVEGFVRYLLTERCLLAGTAAGQAARLRRFLAAYCPPAGVGMLTPAEVTRALFDEGETHAVSSVKRLATR